MKTPQDIAVMVFALLIWAASFSSVTADGPADRNARIAMGRKPEPPPMPKREIRPPTTQPAGQLLSVEDGEFRPLLFIPQGFLRPVDGRINVTVHFHGASWFVIDEHLRRGLNEPLLIVQLGEGSSVYGRPFKDVDCFGRLLTECGSAVDIWADLHPRRNADNNWRGGVKSAVTQVDITSFSAGYGAVREIIQHDRYIDLIRRVILCDSLYAGWDPATTQPGATSRPAEENMRPFEKFVRLAAEGKKTFVLAHSHVPTPYANTAATARWIAELVDAPRAEIVPNSSPASSDADFPLLYRADLGHLHLWGYGGTDAAAHLTSVRHLADIWKALDACGDR